MDPPCEPAILLLGIPQSAHRETLHPTFVAASLTAAKTQNQTGGLLKEEGMCPMSAEGCAAVKPTGLLSAAEQVEPKDVTVTEPGQTEEDKDQMFCLLRGS